MKVNESTTRRKTARTEGGHIPANPMHLARRWAAALAPHGPGRMPAPPGRTPRQPGARSV